MAKVDTEREEAIRLAHRLLDEPHCDPDDELRLLARQFIRATERCDQQVALAQAALDGCRSVLDWTGTFVGPNPAEMLAPVRAAVSKSFFCPANLSRDRAAYQCTNPSCLTLHATNPEGHCPACRQPDGSGWSCVAREWASHTPGPWVIRGEAGKTLCVTDGDSRYVVPRLDAGSRPVAEQLANARLIAAAPDLLASCREAVATLDDMRPLDSRGCFGLARGHDGPCPCTHCGLTRAVRKATGGDQ